MKKITFLLITVLTVYSINAQMSTGVINFASNYTGQIDVDNNGVTVTLTGPSNLWLGIGFGVQSMTFGEDVLTFDSSGLQDREFRGIGVMPIIDSNQDWTEVSNTINGGVRTIIATRGLTGNDSNDFTFIPSATSILLVWARGNGTLNFGNHGGTNRGPTNVGLTLSTFDQELARKVSLYPNPSATDITIDLGDLNLESSKATIYSTVGQLVNEVNLIDKSTRLDTSSLQPGVYLIRITSGDSSVTRRFIKE